ncbi:somatostatin receptor type 2-like [Ptychodera flava]|uniref:somatostatin receptor type 2-like n=1 Tax=Ptychodera flava TaxID=63121 RepID=UPI00396A2798
MTEQAVFTANSSIFFSLNGETSNVTVAAISDAWFRGRVIPITFAVICLVGAVGNFVVIFVLCRDSRKTPSIPSVFILNLAIADFLYVITLPFSAYQYARKEWPFGTIVCKFFIGFDGMNQFTGIFILTAMSVDRYLAIVRPIRCIPYRTVRKARIINVCIWLVSLFFSQPLWIYASVYPYSNVSAVCITDWPDHISDAGPFAFFIFAFVGGFAVPLCCILVCYAKIYSFIIARGKERPGDTRLQGNTRRIAALVIVVVLAFSLCWFPFYILNFISITTPALSSDQLFKMTRFAAICLIYVNSCLNPIIYSFMGENFRKSLRSSRKRRQNYSFVVRSRRTSTNNNCSYISKQP